MLLFVGIFLLTNIIFSLIVYNFLFEIKESSKSFRNELFLYSLGVGPVFTALILYYAFLILPHKTNTEYFLFVIFCYLALLGLSFFISLKGSKNIVNLRDLFDGRYTLFMLILISALTVLISADITKILQNPIIGHDSLEYGNMGKILFGEKSLDPIWIEDFSSQGFIYGVVSKPPSFSLLLTWEKIVGSFFDTNTDLYFKSTTLYYSILMVIILYHMLSKINIPIAILGTIALLTAPDFLLTLLRPHLDSFRIFFQSVSLIFLWYSIKNKSLFSILMLGLFSGFAAFTHTIGLVIAILNSIVFFLFVNEKYKYRILKTFYIVSFIFIFGASHQLFNIIWGRNWIF
jgi:hypothetical protein